MEQAAILKSGIVVKLTGLINPKYTIYGFLNSFQKVKGTETIQYRETLNSDFRKEDQWHEDAVGGFYEEPFFLEYLAKKKELYQLKEHYFNFVLATEDDEVTVKKLKVSAPYTDFCKFETFKWSHKPNVGIVDLMTGEIIIPAGVLPSPLEGESTQLNSTAMAFYSHKIELFVTPITDSNEKQAKAWIIATIALRINQIIRDIFYLFNTEVYTDLGSFLIHQQSQWSLEPIFTNPTIEILQDYLANLSNFYENAYRNQILIHDAVKEDKLYWLARCLTAGALSIVPVIDKLELLVKITKLRLLTENNGGENLALNIVESLTFDSVSASDRNEFLDGLLENQIYSIDNMYNQTNAYDTHQTLFEVLFSKIDDNRSRRYTFGLIDTQDNRKKFIVLLYKIWISSKYNPKYADPSYTQPANAFGIYPESYYMKLMADSGSSIKKTKYYDPITSPAFIHYDGSENTSNSTDYQLISTSVDYILDSLEGKKLKIYRKEITATTQYHSMQENNQHISSFSALYGIYDLYQPIAIIGFKSDLDLIETFKDLDGGINIDNNKTPTIPVFLLYYLEDYSKLKKIDFGVMLAAEVALNLSGVGVLSDLKYIGYLSKMRCLWTAETVVASDVVLSWTAITGVLNAVEFTAFNALSINNYVLNTTDSMETKVLAEKMNTFLIWATICSLGLKLYTQSKVVKAAFELDSVVAEFNNADPPISIYRPDMTPTEIIDFDNALLKVKSIAGNTQIAINGLVTKLTEYGPEADKILNKVSQMSNAEKYAFQLDYGLLENTATRQTLNTNNAAAIENWRLLYADNIIEDRKLLDVITSNDKTNYIIDCYSRPPLKFFLRNLKTEVRWYYFKKRGYMDYLYLDKLAENPNVINLEMLSFRRQLGDLHLMDTYQVQKFVRNNNHPVLTEFLIELQQPIDWRKLEISYRKNVQVIDVNSTQLNTFNQRFINLLPTGNSFLQKAARRVFIQANRLFTKEIKIYNNSTLVETLTESDNINFISNDLNEVDNFIFQNSAVSPELKGKFYNTLDLDSKIAFETFSDAAFDGINFRPRDNDTEIKFIDWFLRTQWNKGNKFDIELESVLYTCPSCQRHLMMLVEHGKKNGKTINIKFFSHPKVGSLRDIKANVN